MLLNICIFSICYELLMYAERAVTSDSCKNNFNQFHFRHSGMSWIKSLMRIYLYWPEVRQDIRNLVRSWRCALAAKLPTENYQP